jgi:putative ABC transport system substrate-binding protein
MNRREFISLLAGSAAAWPLAARAQQGERVRRIGVLMAFAENDPEAKARMAAFRQGLAKRGWGEGRNVQIGYRFATPGDTAQYRAFAKELIALQSDVVVAHSPAVVDTFKRESSSLPIVFVNVSDPIGAGFIASLARPGGNLTGVLHYEAGIVGKWLALLKEIAPRIRRVALVANRSTTASFGYFMQSARAAAAQLAIEVEPRAIENTADVERSIESFAGSSDGGLVFPPDAITLTNRDLVIALAARYRLPAIYPIHAFVAAGGLMSYGTDQNDMFRLAASYADRILRGDEPADLPVQAPTKYETAVNLKTAKALGLTVPPALLVAADEVIE